MWSNIWHTLPSQDLNPLLSDRESNAISDWALPRLSLLLKGGPFRYQNHMHVVLSSSSWEWLLRICFVVDRQQNPYGTNNVYQSKLSQLFMYKGLGLCKSLSIPVCEVICPLRFPLSALAEMSLDFFFFLFGWCTTSSLFASSLSSSLRSGQSVCLHILRFNSRLL